jgi:hypothetical protein
MPWSKKETAANRPYLIKGSDTHTGQNVGLLTRLDPFVDLKTSQRKVEYPMASSSCVGSSASSSSFHPKIQGTKGISKHFIASFHVEELGKPLTLIAAHLLVNPTDPKRCMQREAQAQVLRELADDAFDHQKHHVVLTGDLNDWSATAVDCNGHVPISQTLSLLDYDEKYKNVALHVTGARALGTGAIEIGTIALKKTN